MPKPKFPKKNNDTKASTITTNTAPASANIGIAPLEVATVASSSPEVKKVETRKTEPAKTIRKPEIVKTELRANLVPINVEDEIRRLAYLFSERRGFLAGHESEDWLNAEREVRQRYHQLSA